MDDLLKKVAAAIKEGRAATKQDLLANYKLEITVSPDYIGYCNPRVAATVDGLSSSEVTHVKYIPLVAEGHVIMLPASSGEDGAVEFSRSDSRRTATIPMRIALNGFKLEFPDDRKLTLPVQAVDVDLGKDSKTAVLLIRVKRVPSKKREVRPRKNSSAKAAKATTTNKAAEQAPAPEKKEA